MKLVTVLLAAKRVNIGPQLFLFLYLSLLSAILKDFTKEKATVMLVAGGA